MKKEPKQEWKPKEGEEVWIKVFSNWSLGKYIGYDVDKKVHLVREPEEGGGHLFSSPYILHYSALPNEPKQETLEEAARKWYSNTKLFDKGELNAFIAGAKYQSERMYTYDELRQIAYNAYCKGQLDEPTEGKFNLWIQQFKKK